MAETQSDALSIMSESQRDFDTAMRGYDRRQVDDHLAHVDEDLRAAAGERDAATARSADLAAQLASSQAQIESLRRQLRSATTSVDESNLDPAVRQILDVAQADAARLRGDVDAYAQQARRAADENAERTRAAARAEADQMIDAATRRHVEADDEFRRRIAEADRYRIEVVERAAMDVATARQEEEHLTARAEHERTRLATSAADERDRLDVEARQKIMTGLEDFEITLRERRTAEAKQSADERAAATAEAHRIVTEARASAEQMVAEATARVVELDGHRDRTHGDLNALHGRLTEVIATTGPAVADAAAPEPAADVPSNDLNEPVAESGVDGG